MSWETWEKTWRVHARSRSFATKVTRAHRTIREARRRGLKLAVSLSGGKDSVAMSGLVAEVLATETEEQRRHRPVKLAHASGTLVFPDTLRVVEETADILGMELDVLEPDDIEEHVRRVAKHYRVTPAQPRVDGSYDEWSILETIPLSESIVDPTPMAFLLRACASGNMMVAYTYAEELDGTYVGLRANESKGRAAYAMHRGPIYQNKQDDCWMVCPLLSTDDAGRWTSSDVYAYILDRGLPMHPYYRAAYEKMGLRDPEHLRVDLSIVGSALATRGALAPIRLVYPDVWRRMVAVRPELAQFV